ncbi:MAG: CoA transferase [Dehalococcoidia bacterium]|nr:CoA transferase [Dehalococcoidia bacterium]
MNNRPLKGLNVLDMSWFGAGPIAGRALANAGANVIKLETEKRIDGLRAMAPRPKGGRGYNLSGYFNNYNSDKKSITIDLTTEKGYQLGLELIKWADVMLTNMTNRATNQIKMDWETVSKVNPKLVAAYMPMMGMSGPYKDFQGFGAMLTAICGMNYLAGFEKNRPVGVGTNYPDYVINPMHAYIAILSAVRIAKKTDLGQKIELSQNESSIAAMALPIFAFDNANIDYKRNGNSIDFAAPHGVYKCKDDHNGSERWIAITCINEDQWNNIVKIIDDKSLATKEYLTLDHRKENEQFIDQTISAWTAKHTAEELQAKLQSLMIPAGIVQNAQEVVEDEHMIERGYFVKLDHAEAGQRLYDGTGWKMTKTPIGMDSAAPLLGEHTFEICTSILNLQPENIADLVAEQVLY